MGDWPLLTLVTFLPLLGALAIFAFAHGPKELADRNARSVALMTTTLTFLVSLMVWGSFDPKNPDFQLLEQRTWLAPGIAYVMGVDGISVLFVVLTSFLMPLCILASWEAIEHRVREYMIAFLMLETMMNGVFCALDAVLFYLFFEGGLIPMFLIIGIWGGQRRVYSTFKFFLYTLAGSVLLLLAFIYMYYQVGSTDIRVLMRFARETGFALDAQNWLWLALFASFAVKMPMWPVHTWLPDAHVEAPTAGSVILAGVLLKMGGYGFIRFSMPLLPNASEVFVPLIFVLSIIAVIYTSLVALMQDDMKKLIAYSSVAHMGFVTLGLFTFTTQGVEGAMIQMLSHGVVSAALFLCVGVVYDRMHSRAIASYGGLVHRMPVYAFCFMVFTLASVGLPGTSGFVGELLVLVGTFKVNTWAALLASTGVVLGAAYMLWLYRRVVFGKLEKANLMAIADMNRREIAVFAPLIAVTLWMGIYPKPFLEAMHGSITLLLEQHQVALKTATAGAATFAQLGQWAGP